MMSRASRYELAASLARRYALADRKQKGRLLDEFTAATGYNRKYAVSLLQRPPGRRGLQADRVRAAANLDRRPRASGIRPGRRRA